MNKSLTEHVQSIGKEFDEIVDHSPESYYQGFVGKDGTKYENVLVVIVIVVNANHPTP